VGGAAPEVFVLQIAPHHTEHANPHVHHFSFTHTNTQTRTGIRNRKKATMAGGGLSFSSAELTSVRLYQRGGAGVVVHALFFVVYAYVVWWCFMTCGEPHRDMLELKQELRDRLADAAEAALGAADAAADATAAVAAAMSDEDLLEAGADSLSYEEQALLDSPLPSSLLPGFWACVALAATVTFHLLFIFMCHWMLALRAVMEYRP
jgi:hypothetical protein